MNDKKKNASNVFTKKCMVTALMQLMEEKPFSNISITEITNRAGVSRMAYYRNYKSKEDIFRTYLKDILDVYYQESLADHQNGHYYDIVHLEHCFKSMECHKDFINSLFKGGLGNILLEGFGRYMAETWYKGNDIREYYELESFAGALYNVFIAWAGRGKKESSRQMAGIMHSIYVKET